MKANRAGACVCLCQRNWETFSAAESWPRETGTGRIRMSSRTWLSSQGPCWTLAQGQLPMVPQPSAEPCRSTAQFLRGRLLRAGCQQPAEHKLPALHLLHSGEVEISALLPPSQRPQEVPQTALMPSSDGPRQGQTPTKYSTAVEERSREGTQGSLGTLSCFS